MGFYCILLGLFQNLGYSVKLTQIIRIFFKNTWHLAKLTIFQMNFPKTREILDKMSANSIDFSKNSGNSRQNVQYFSQKATLLVAFPKYSGHSSQFTTCL